MKMPRYCGACGRSLDIFGHDIARDDKGEFKRAHVIGMARGRGRLAYGRVKQYSCRVRLVATSPSTGRTLPANDPQRIKELDTRFVHRERLQPGGDLHYAS
jgi:hypothetical protein